MTIIARCECGLLHKWSLDPTSRIERDLNGSYVLALGRSQNITISYCPSCGGKASENSGLDAYCTCGSVKNWGDDPDSPVKFDGVFNEYYLGGTDNQEILFYYCPICGGALEQSQRGEFFTRPVPSEMVGLRMKLEGVKSLEDVVATMGIPDDTLVLESSTPAKDIYGFENPKRAIKYTSVSKTFDLTVVETTDGQIKVIIEGKRKGSESINQSS